MIKDARRIRKIDYYRTNRDEPCDPRVIHGFIVSSRMRFPQNNVCSDLP